jgi:hypothetical protein
MSRRLLCVSFCAAALCSAEPAVAATTPPGGIYAILEASVPDQYPVATQALQTPGVDGLLIHLR